MLTQALTTLASSPAAGADVAALAAQVAGFAAAAAKEEGADALEYLRRPGAAEGRGVGVDGQSELSWPRSQIN